jgi:hypothetical protein
MIITLNSTRMATEMEAILVFSQPEKCSRVFQEKGQRERKVQIKGRSL